MQIAVAAAQLAARWLARSRTRRGAGGCLLAALLQAANAAQRRAPLRSSKLAAVGPRNCAAFPPGHSHLRVQDLGNGLAGVGEATRARWEPSLLLPPRPPTAMPFRSPSHPLSEDRCAPLDSRHAAHEHGSGQHTTALSTRQALLCYDTAAHPQRPVPAVHQRTSSKFRTHLPASERALARADPACAATPPPPLPALRQLCARSAPARRRAPVPTNRNTRLRACARQSCPTRCS